MYTKDNIGTRIRTRRKELNMTQQELADKINAGVDSQRTQISQWEQGKKVPETDALIRLCNALDCDIDYLLSAIETPRRATYDVAEQTGLDAKAVECLMQIKHKAEIERIFGYSGNMLAPNTQGLKALSYLLQHNSIKGRDFLRTLYSLVFGNYDRFAIDMETDSGEIAIATSYVAALVDKETGKSQNLVSIKSLEKIYMLEIQEYFWALRDKARGERAEGITVDFEEK